jgi:hypothetical protein
MPTDLRMRSTPCSASRVRRRCPELRHLGSAEAQAARQDVRDEGLDLRDRERVVKPARAHVGEVREQLVRPVLERELAAVHEDCSAPELGQHAADELVDLEQVVRAVGGGIKASGRLEHAGDLGEGSRSIRHVIEHVVRHDRVEARVGKRQGLGIDALKVRRALERAQVHPRLVEHPR